MHLLVGHQQTIKYSSPLTDVDGLTVLHSNQFNSIEIELIIKIIHLDCYASVQDIFTSFYCHYNLYGYKLNRVCACKHGSLYKLCAFGFV